MKSPNFIFPVLITLVSSILVLNSSDYMSAKASDGFNTGRTYFEMSPRVTENDYKAKTVILKINQDLRTYCSNEQISIASLQDLLSSIGATGVTRMFPHAEQPKLEKNRYGLKYADLTLIYEFKYTGAMDLVQVINEIYRLDIVEYAQPYYIHQLSYTPNDPQVGSQYHIGSVKAYQAWDIQKGDPNVTVAIVDSGSDIDHEDFLSQFKYNTADPIDGLDNDNDGYIDNNLGWDFVDEDNNTQMFGSNHGVHVAGCAVAATDNGVGISAPAFGCSYLPVKAGDGQTVDFGYPGITYAADHGASVINCSWGGAGGGQLGQDVIDYATINKDALVVAAAGNDGVEDAFFPASYNYVLNVASTASNDTKSGFSNYGYVIDLCAPGSSIWATDNNDGYTIMSGTSMASPVAAGCAALVRSEYPFLDALAVGEQLKVTCDNIYPVNQGIYQDKLGAGRINLFNAVSGITQPSIVMTEKNISDGGDEAFVVGDTISIDGIFVNLLAPSGSITGTLTSQSANVQIIDGTTSLGVMNPFGGTADNLADPFSLIILSGASLNERVTLELELTDGSYTTTIFFQIIVNVDYINVTINDVATSITSKSLIGFNDFSVQQEGLGFIYPYSILGTGSNILFDCGLMIGVPNNVSDNVRTTGGGTDQDFISVNNVQRLPTPIFSEFDIEGDFNDSGSTGPLAIDIAHKAFAWSETGHRKYVIVEYTITNNSGGALNDLYAGLYADWDINDFAQNKGGTVDSRRLGYIYDTQTAGVWAGMQVVSISGDFIHNAMFNNQGDDPGGSGVYPNTSYETADKYASLSTMDMTSGGTGVGKDVSNVVSTGPFNIAVGGSITVAFALMAGDDLADITETADSAYIKYNGIPIPCSDLIGSTTSTDDDGTSNGTATVNSTGGTLPHTYAWNTTPAQNTQIATGLAAGTYVVTISDAAGCQSTASVTVTSGAPIGIGQNAISFVTGVFPNPNEGIVTVSFGDNAADISLELSLRNLIGQEVMVKQVLLKGQNEIRLNLESLNKGAYFLTVTGNESKQTLKILVQ
ncbi:MAG: S8 family serine peptidase [Flavobacteriales bacterium]|nr:S8 family serine peptidase [Flavobacteriales bacterium]